MLCGWGALLCAFDVVAPLRVSKHINIIFVVATRLRALASARDSSSHHCDSSIAMMVAAKAKANGSSPAVPKQAGSVEQPATFLPLRELTDRSARIAQFKLSVVHPWEDTYTYYWGGEERKTTTLKHLLVDVNDPTC